MKKFAAPLLFIAVFCLISCDSDDKDDGLFADYLVARPITMTRAEFANSVAIVPPRPLESSGKIYAYRDFIFVNDKHKGVHLIDNSDPSAPQKRAFIKIAGNVDISVKGDYLYADSLSDLIVLDISDLDNIRVVNRLYDVLNDPVVWPAEADFFEYGEIDYENEVLLGWELVTERRLIAETPVWRDDVAFAEMAADANARIGQGGSLARFKIVEDFLYAVDSHFINIFDISDLGNPLAQEDVYAGFDIETIFSQGNYLFLGSMRGMYIYEVSDPARPGFISEFQHGTACDPVVVDGDYAYVTLRGGNDCGATESGLFIIDIRSIANPVLAASYPMDEPYGLGIKGDQLFVCDGASGLKVYDKSSMENLVPLQHLEGMVTYDVIPLDETLVLIADGSLHQYAYQPDEIQWVSTLQLH